MDPVRDKSFDKKIADSSPSRISNGMDELKSTLEKAMRGEVTDAKDARHAVARDTSIFERVPALVVSPKDTKDVSTLVQEVQKAKRAGQDVSLAARAAGSCMSGGPLTTSIVVDFMPHMNKVLEVHVGRLTSHMDERPRRSFIEGYAVTEPGVYYRDFEKKTLEKGVIMPSYPASRELAAMGGIVGNDAGGEKTLAYGKTRKYVEEMEVVLADGSVAALKPLVPEELEDKKLEQNFEGQIYRAMDELLVKHHALIESHRPKVSKNSAGYALWDVRDYKTGSFNLAKLVTGSQGTLALWTRAKLSLVKPKAHRAMLVIFLNDLAPLPDIVNRVLPLTPESFESFDDHTFKLAIKFIPGMLEQMGFLRAAELGISFLPEIKLLATGGIPKLLLMAEFAEDTIEEADRKAAQAEAAIKEFGVKTKIEKDETESEKFWIMRRESFALLRKHTKGLSAAPFIDDFVVPPSSYPQFLPKLNALLAEYESHFIYTIAGHIGDGNFHIIPLMDLSKPENHEVVLELAPKVYELVLQYGGTTTGEHNDGIIRTPYLHMQFGEEMMRLFEETKRIFDPENILNPGKKVGGTFEDIKRDMITSWQ